MPTQPRLTKKQLETLRSRLQDERGRLVRVLEASGVTPAGEEERSEIEEAAQRETERTQLLELLERERALLADVERALAKLEAGGYGVSEKTGEPIPYERLVAVPWARQGADE